MSGRNAPSIHDQQRHAIDQLTADVHALRARGNPRAANYRRRLTILTLMIELARLEQETMRGHR